MRTGIIISSCLLLLCGRLLAQGGSNVKYGPNQAAYVDSIKRSTYKWMFPAWGQRIVRKGFDLPYATGISLNTYVGSQEVIVSDLKVGFNDHEPVPLDFVKFGKVKADIQSVTVRPDLWVLPFVDLYGILGISYAQTDVSVVAPFNFSTKAKFSGSTFGIGTTLAGGYRGIIIIIDVNHTWTSFDNIKGSIEASMLTPRLGINMISKKNPRKRTAIWVGAPGAFINRTTEGTINLNQLHSTQVSKPDLEKAADGSADWYASLTPAQKEVMQHVAQKILNKINNHPDDDATISYSLVKKPTSKWSMCVGGQYQFSHVWQLRTEVGFLGGRKSFLLSGSYRFRW